MIKKETREAPVPKKEKKWKMFGFGVCGGGAHAQSWNPRQAMQLWEINDDVDGMMDHPPILPLLPQHDRVDRLLDAMDDGRNVGQGQIEEDNVIHEDAAPTTSACARVAEFWCLRQGARLLDVQRELALTSSSYAKVLHTSTRKKAMARQPCSGLCSLLFCHFP